MSKTSYALICIMMAALCYMGAVRAYQFYQSKVEAQQEMYGNTSLSRLAEADNTESVPTLWQAPAEDIFLEEKPLSQVKKEQQAKETIQSILNDYRMNPALRKFHADLEEATHGQVKRLDDLSGSNLANIMAEHPEIRSVVSKHMQSADFAAALQQIFSNPQFQQSVQDLQGKSIPTQTQTAE
jgi:hypothetical protein